MPPGSFGPFRVLHQIGTGVLGPVFRTYEPARDRLVAVKAFRLDLTPEQARAFADELQRVAAAGLDHPSIVRPLAAGVEGTIPYTASEYVAAESLDIAMRHYAPAAIETVLPFITQLAGAIDFARTAGVGHGALHPRDIFVTPDEARATGFGVVQALETLGVRAPVRRPYTAPERVAGAAWDVRADIYSLGAIAFELLTGRRPVGAEIGDLGQTAGPHADTLGASLSRALAGDPAARYPSALAFAAALEASSRGGHAAATGEEHPVVEEEARPRTLVVEPEEMALPESYEEFPDDIVAEREEDLADIQLKEEEALRHQRAEESPAPAERAEETAVPAVEPEPSPRFVEEPRVAPEESVLRPDEPAAAVPFFDFDETSDAGIPEIQHPMVEEFVRPSEPQPERRPEREREPEPVGPREPVEPAEPRRAAVRPRPVLLPIALTLLLGLFVGFLAGYLVGARDVGTTESGPSSSLGSQGSPGSPGSGAGSVGSIRPRPEPAEPEPRAPVEPREPREPLVAAPAPSSAAPVARPAPRARLVVRSIPPGAAVFVNGRRRGSTPLALRELAPGSYAVRVTRTGYREDTRKISIAAGSVRDVTIRLERARPPARPASAGAFAGSIYVDSRPRGARVLLDGRQIGTTPLQVGAIRAGAHVIRLELANHRPWSTSIRVVAGEVTRVTGSLERQP